jgi:hypothetical protein
MTKAVTPTPNAVEVGFSAEVREAIRLVQRG